MCLFFLVPGLCQDETVLFLMSFDTFIVSLNLLPAKVMSFEKGRKQYFPQGIVSRLNIISRLANNRQGSMVVVVLLRPDKMKIKDNFQC